ncbi:MAG: purine nucleoside permease [Sphingomonadales bacterium]|nr:purine nucleoside permease [Sphingomonadales bacterium]MDE2168159.1 purine nucleoside permease [Sphingomonadales bacterium]
MLSAVFALMAQPAFARAPATHPMDVRVVVVTAFEIGEDTGDRSGEFQAWAKVLPQKIPFPAGVRNLRYDPKTHVLAISTGEGTGHAAASIMALGMDPRFDLTHAYWVVAAIAGVNPNTGSAGSAAWIGDVIDSDFSYAIDPREAPQGWATGTLPYHRLEPYQQPVPDSSDNLFPLNHALRDWAYGLTRDIALADSKQLQDLRATYAGFPEAQKPPHVMVGEEVSGQSFWIGAMLNTHAEEWTRYWTGAKGTFVMTAMEDTGVARSLAMLAKAGKVAPDRLLVLRTASDYSAPPHGQSAHELMLSEMHGHFPAFDASLDAAWRVGGKVVFELANHWPRYRDHTPGAPS